MVEKKYSVVQSFSINLAFRLYSKEVRAAEKFLAEVRGRQMDILIPCLVIMLEHEHEQNKHTDFGGTLNRFDVAKKFTALGFHLDFNFASDLLNYACKKKKAYLLFPGDQGSDPAYGSPECYEKYNKDS
jgi:hypothetical protein